MNYLISNKEWIFSGIGVLILSVLIGYLKTKRESNPEFKNLKILNGNNNFQTDGEVNINNTTNVYGETDLVKKDSPLNILAKKFFNIFENHGIKRGQIPSFIDSKFEIKYADVVDEETIIPKLNDELLDWVADKFCIKRSWFDADEGDYYHNELYDSIDCYKYHWRFQHLFEDLIDEYNPYDYKSFIKVSFFKNFEEFKGDSTDDNAKVLIVVELLIGKTTTGPIYKYILVQDNLFWSYKKSRHDLKRMIRIVEQLGIPNDGYDLSDKEFIEIVSKKVVPRNILNKFRQVTWYPYDFNGSINHLINELEYENDLEFKESLKVIDMEIQEMIEDKKIQLMKLLDTK
ncbi:hypothetical protein [Lysinibacillus sp. NPDC056185]|uniref:hypothetical protein n=1 Tax=Lysinibacillus sp. NPDC056185 TaxID=3345739 RepID=UPI0039EDEA6E